MKELRKIRKKLLKRATWGATGLGPAFKFRFFKTEGYYIYRFLLHLRKYEYLIKQKTTLLTKIRRAWNFRQYSKFAKECGFSIMVPEMTVPF